MTVALTAVSIPGDALFVQFRLCAASRSLLTEMCPYVYENAYSPHLASRMEGNPVVTFRGKKRIRWMSHPEYDYVTVEGSGGILCPICFDERREFSWKM